MPPNANITTLHSFAWSRHPAVHPQSFLFSAHVSQKSLGRTNHWDPFEKPRRKRHRTQGFHLPTLETLQLGTFAPVSQLSNDLAKRILRWTLAYQDWTKLIRRNGGRQHTGRILGSALIGPRNQWNLPRQQSSVAGSTRQENR